MRVILPFACYVRNNVEAIAKSFIKILVTETITGTESSKENETSKIRRPEKRARPSGRQALVLRTSRPCPREDKALFS